MTSAELTRTPQLEEGGAGAPRAATTADHKWWTLAAVCLGTFMLLLDITIVNVALPAIQSSLHSSFADLQWVVDAYAFTLAALLLTAGSLADMFGRRLLYIIGLIVFTAGSALCGAAQSSLMLELSRGLQGVGGAVMFSVSLALLATAFQGKERGVAFGVWGAITGIAVAVGPIVGGALVTELSWRWIFFVNLPIGVVAVAITAARVAESRAQNARRPDWPGFVTFTAALAALIYALIESGITSFGDTRVVACFIAAGVLMVAFLVAEVKSAHPMFDLSLFRLPTFSGGSIAAFGISASIFAMLLYLVLYLQDVLAYSALQTGLRLLVLSGGILAVSTVAGRLTSRIPVRFLIGPGLIAVGVSLLLMRGLGAGSTWTHLIPGLIVGGVGVGFINPPLASTAVGVVDPSKAGMASGINSTFRQVGIATGIALLGTLFASKLASAVSGSVRGTPLASRSGAITNGLKDGVIAPLFHQVPSRDAGLLERVLRGSFASALDEILLIAAIIALASGVLAFFLIRTRDFHASSQGGSEGTGAAADDGEADPGEQAAPAMSTDGGAPASNGFHAHGSDGDHGPQPASPVIDLDGAGRAASEPAPNGTAPSGGEALVGRVHSSAGHPLGGAVVTVIGPGGGEVGHTLSAEDGTYRLAVGTAEATGAVASAASHLPLALAVGTNGNGMASYDFELVAVGRLVVSVRGAAGSPPPADAVVTFRPAGAGDHADQRARDVGAGTWHVEGLLEGRYELRVAAPGHKAGVAAAEVSAGATTHVELTLDSTADIDGVVRAGAHGLAGMAVSLLDGTGHVVRTATTDTAGRYRFAEVGIGEYTVLAAGLRPLARKVTAGAGDTAEADMDLA